MNRADTARLLAVVAAFDRRTVGETDVIAWSDVLGDLSPNECVDAVRFHFANSSEWLMPAHVRAHVVMVRDRIRERDHAERLHAEYVQGARENRPIHRDIHTWGQPSTTTRGTS